MKAAIENGEIILYQPDERSTSMEVRIDDETVWLSQNQMVELFSSTRQNVSLHINNIFKEKELDQISTVKEYLTVQLEGSRKVKRKVILYNLDVIISVGYRVKSKRGTQFRIWANRILRDYLLKGYAINHRIDKIEKTLFEHDQKFDLLIRTNLPPHEGIFYDGQVFDAYIFVSDLIKSASKSIVLIDNYVDQTVLSLLSKRNANVDATVYSASFSKQFNLDLKQFNAQYPAIGVKTFTKSHDRFLIIDNAKIYHIGASLKDLGKKWFAFAKIELDPKDLIKKLNNA